ncbi:MAG: sigma-70 family RNA polymerase sigma factor [Chitinivibrionales bacterium]|nr:sigma-70 family RNA polymerase sigma factor [Chitinivibrionales bacterium]MBD3396200.1 sigma-70 family RNA polymerase sigma factor [Chitinivibrionales bacterium]
MSNQTEAMKELDDITIRAAAAGDETAFRRFYDHYSPFIWRVVLRTVRGNRDQAAQIVQDIFVKTYFSLKSYRFRSALSTWLYRIAYTKTLNSLRRTKGEARRMQALEEMPDRKADAGAFEKHDMVGRILESLAPEERFLLIAREMDGVPFEDLEKMTGKSSGSLRTRLSRLKDSIRREFGNGRHEQALVREAL